MRDADRKNEDGRPVRVLMLASVASMIDQFNMPNIRLLQGMGCEVHVACNFQKGNTCSVVHIAKFMRRLEQTGVYLHQWDCPRNVCRFTKCVKAFVQLWRLTQTTRFSLIHCHSPAGGALARAVAHFHRIPVIYTAHGFHFYKGAPLKNWLLYYPVEKLLAYWTDVLITVNREDNVFAVKNLPVNKVYRIPGVGIDTARFATGRAGSETSYAFRTRHRIPQDALLLLSVGELSRRKNHRVVLEALAALDRKDVYYMICGKGRLRGWLVRYAERLGIANRLCMAGYTEHVEEAYRAADIFVFPSIQEGMPVALMEAMASGLCCTASDIRGNRELVCEWAGSGIRFRPDSPRELQAALETLLDNETLRDTYGRNGRRHSMNYDFSRVLGIMEKIYHDSLPVGAMPREIKDVEKSTGAALKP